uniref:Carboxylesterase type B domain-containing protein n=1 Tax=Rhodnius prolixus TaxID=13249 RepID=T1HHT3_RHOPR
MIQLQVITKLLLLKIVFVECSELIVNTTQGQLRGREFKSRNGRKVAAFSGIPFAKPPLGQLRFQLKPSKLLPVIFYIPGGGFNFGSGEIDKTPEYFMDYDVVVVMHNYRLGPFGITFFNYYK